MASLELLKPFNTVLLSCSDAEHCKLAGPWLTSWQLLVEKLPMLWSKSCQCFGQQAFNVLVKEVISLQPTCRSCAVSKQQQCMHELAVMFRWASLARTCLRVWQRYAECSANKKKQWVSLALPVL